MRKLSYPLPSVPLVLPARGADELQEVPATMSIDPALAVSPPRHHGAGETPAPVVTGALTRREHDMLAFERQWWRRAGAKDTAIRAQFGMPPTRYYQVLNALVDRPDVLASDPLLVRRLRRLRAARHRRRTSEVLGKGARAV
jgi:hypothetical protein